MLLPPNLQYKFLQNKLYFLEGYKMTQSSNILQEPGMGLWFYKNPIMDWQLSYFGLFQYSHQGCHTQSFLHKILGGTSSMWVHWDPPACPRHQKGELTGWYQLIQICNDINSVELGECQWLSNSECKSLSLTSLKIEILKSCCIHIPVRSQGNSETIFAVQPAHLFSLSIIYSSPSINSVIHQHEKLPLPE